MPDIGENHHETQAPKGKRRTGTCGRPRGPAHFTAQVAKALKAAVDAGYPIKIELGTPSAPVTEASFKEWKRNRAD